MGKTGTTRWIKVKNGKGKYRLVPEKRTGFKKPGPKQRYDGKGRLRRRIRRSPSSLVK